MHLILRIREFTKNNLDYILLFTSLLLISIYGLVYAIGTDTSWIINRIDQYTYDKKFIDIVHSVNSGSWENLFTVINSYLSLLLNQLYFTYWIFNFIYSLLGVYLLYKLLFILSLEKRNVYLGVFFYIILAYFSGIFIGTRFENIYVSSIVILIFFINSFLKSDKYIWIYFSSIISVFGALSHPNGLILFVILFIFAIKLIVIKKFSIVHFIFNILIICGLFYYGLFFGQTYSEFLNFFQNISNDSAHSLPFYYEPKRYISFVLNHSLIAPLFLFGLFTLALYMKKYLLYFKEYFFENLLAISALFIIIYLTFIGAKWEYYLSLLFPFVVISIVEYIQDKNFNKNLFIGIGFVLMIVTIGKDFKKNEEFLSLLHIPSQRVNIVNEVKSIIKDSTVYAPMRLYVMHKYHNRFVPLERVDIGNEKIDFVILDFSIAKEQYDKKLDKNLEYMQSFIYNDHYYNLFRVNDAK